MTQVIFNVILTLSQSLLQVSILIFCSFGKYVEVINGKWEGREWLCFLDTLDYQMSLIRFNSQA